MELRRAFPRPEQQMQYLQAVQQALEHSAPPPVLQEDIVEALRENKPSATAASVRLYERWEAEHGAS